MKMTKIMMTIMNMNKKNSNYHENLQKIYSLENLNFKKIPMKNSKKLKEIIFKIKILEKKQYEFEKIRKKI